MSPVTAVFVSRKETSRSSTQQDGVENKAGCAFTQNIMRIVLLIFVSVRTVSVGLQQRYYFTARNERKSVHIYIKPQQATLIRQVLRYSLMESARYFSQQSDFGCLSAHSSTKLFLYKTQTLQSTVAEDGLLWTISGSFRRSFCLSAKHTRPLFNFSGYTNTRRCIYWQHKVCMM